MTAPVIVFAYNRLEHLERTLAALDLNKLCHQTDLFIYADGYKNEHDRTRVQAVHDYLDQYKEKSNFKNVVVKKSDVNQGLAKSVISGVTEVMEIYHKVIVVEDDLITSENFLFFMNGALDYYEKADDIWSVSGFSVPLKSLRKYAHDIYYTYRGSSYGWGTWKDRWDTVDWEVENYEAIKNDSLWNTRFSRGGKDLPGMLERQMNGEIDSWAVRWVLAQSSQNRYTIYPKVSRLCNAGMDGSGTHSDKNSYFKTVLSTANPEVKFERLHPERKINKEFNRLFEYTLQKKIHRRIVKLQNMLRGELLDE